MKSTLRTIPTMLIAMTVFMGLLWSATDSMAGYSSLDGTNSCLSCHARTSATGYLAVAIEGKPAASVTVAPGGGFELDWTYSLRGSPTEFSSGTMLTTPTGWSVAAGTANSPALPVWKSAWDLADGVGWNKSGTTCVVAGASCFSIDYAGTPWDSGGYDVACDTGGVCTAGPGVDLDGVQDQMGTDARITVPVGTAPGSYTVNVYAIGHETGERASARSSFKLQAVTVQVVAAGTTVVGDGTAPANKTVHGSDVNEAVSTFTLAASSPGTVTQVQVTGSGSGVAAVAAGGVKLWKDTGSIPNEWDPDDSQVGTGQSFSSSVAAFSGLSESVGAVPVTYLVTCNIIASPTAGQTILARVSSVSALNTVVNNDSTDATLTIAADPIPYISLRNGDWNATNSWNRNAVPTAGSKVIISSGNTITVNAANAALGDLTVNGTLSVGAFNISVSGTTAVNGTLTHTSATGTKTYTGRVTINQGATWNSGAAPINFRGGVTNNGTFTPGIGVHTFSTNAQTIGGANPISIPNVTVTTVTLTNSGTLSVGTALSGTGGVNNLGTLNIGGTSGITTLAAIPRGNLVNYSGTGASQAVRNINYYDLTLSGSGTKTLQSGSGAIAGDLKLLGTVSVSTVDNLYVTGDIEIGSGATLTTTGYTLYMGGLVSVSGTFTFSGSTTGSKNFYGPVVINTGGRWNNAINEGFVFRGGFTNNSSAIHTFGTGTYTFNTNVQTIGGMYPISIPKITVTGTTLTNTGTLTVGTALSGTGELAQGSGATLNIGGTSSITTLTATAAGNTINYSGAAQTVKPTSYNNLTLSGSGAKSIASGTTVAGALSLAPTGTATASIAAGFKLNVGALALAGVPQGTGSYGSTSSAAINKNNTYFALTTGYILNGAPIFTSAASTSLTYGTAATFTVTTDANPAVTSIAKTGILPVGIIFKDNGNGSATISGTPNSSGTFNLVFTASNGTSTKTQSFTVTVSARDINTTSAVDTDISVAPNRHLFGVVPIDSCGSPITFTVKNSGTTSRTLETLSFSGNDADQYQFGTTNTCSANTLAAGASCTVEVKFCPTSTGSKGATLLIPSNDPETPTLAAILYNYESLDEEAARRLPPVLQNLDIPTTCMTAGQPCTITWSLLGYDEDYLSRIVLFDCTGILGGSCGSNVTPNIGDSGHMSAISSSTGVWGYTNGGTVYSKKFDYSYTFTAPAAGPVVIRFYRKSLDDDSAGLSSLSLLIPGNQNQAGISYYDNQGRRLQYTIQ